MDNLIVRTGLEAQKAIEYFLVDLEIGLKAAKDRGIQLRRPDYVDVQITYIKELAAETEDSTSTTPEVTEETTQVQGAATDTSTQTSGAQQNTSSPPSQTTIHTSGGQDVSETRDEYEG